MPRANYNYVSLFCGCGGFDYGINKYGFHCLGAYDIDHNAVDTYTRNCSISATKIDLSKTIPQIKSNSCVDMVISGSPCQGFSTAGKRRIDDNRNSLLVQSGIIAIQYATKVYIAENVPGVISGQHKRYWDELHCLFRNNGYYTKDFKINCHDIGVAQERNRMIFIAWKGRDNFNLISYEGRKNKLRDAIDDLQNENDHSPTMLHPDSTDLLIARRIKPGQKLCNVRGGERAVPTWSIPEVYGRVNIHEINVLEAIRTLRRRLRLRKYGDADPVLPDDVSCYLKKNVSNYVRSLVDKGYLKIIDDRVDLRLTFNGKFRRLLWDSPSNTVDTVFGNPKFFLHPRDNRGFTVREAARIQSFPDEFVFTGPTPVKYRMIGNAVPPLLGSHLGLSAFRFLRG